MDSVKFLNKQAMRSRYRAKGRNRASAGVHVEEAMSFEWHQRTDQSNLYDEADKLV